MHAPICSPSGVAFFGRDVESSKQVWSRDEGYPGDPYYRDFYRDIGFDLPEEDLMGEVAGDGSRLMTGLKYYRITGKDVEKAPYQPGVARERAWEHAGNFVFNRAKQVEALDGGRMPVPPIVVAPYDAELYGHWWFEGPHLPRGRVPPAARGRRARSRPSLSGSYLDRHPVTVEATPSASSWGAGGYGEVWVGHEAAWTWRHVHHATRYARWLVENHRARGRAPRASARPVDPRAPAPSVERLALHPEDRHGDALRRGRIRAHVHRLRHLGYLVETGTIEGNDPAWLDDLCQRDNFLAGLSGDELRRWFD